MVLQRLSYYAELFTVAYFLSRLGKILLPQRVWSFCLLFGPVCCWPHSTVCHERLRTGQVTSRSCLYTGHMDCGRSLLRRARGLASVSNRTSSVMDRHENVVIRTRNCV